MDDTFLPTLTDEYLKDILRFSFVHCGFASGASSACLDVCVLLIRRHGFAEFLEFLESGEQEELRFAALAARGYIRALQAILSAQQPPSTPPPSLGEALAEYDRLTEAANAAFDARVQQITPTYLPRRPRRVLW